MQINDLFSFLLSFLYFTTTAAFASANDLHIKVTIDEIRTKPLIVVDKNAEVCGTNLWSNSLECDPTGGLKNAIVFLIGVNQVHSASQGTNVIKLSAGQCQFNQKAFSATGITLIELSNNDLVPHNPHGKVLGNDRTVFNITLFNTNLVIRRKLQSGDFYAVECDTHRWMSSYIAIFDHPFHAVTDDRGECLIRNASLDQDSKLVIWHELFGFRTNSISTFERKVGTLTVEIPFNSAMPTTNRYQTLPPWTTWINSKQN